MGSSLALAAFLSRLLFDPVVTQGHSRMRFDGRKRNNGTSDGSVLASSKCTLVIQIRAQSRAECLICDHKYLRPRFSY